ncbi:DNA-binding transcriptional LysR family regulator [Natronocella acetinitrilica]|uniref:DNA-binding transcriptional LysR family regulator n=1 Tax=Natronocella acetinitrilica TaxID=414046 RepID=A0AAE3G756_9GAMM|nr:LysR family transcriptional regulator [Natronocella acetinitrilica]MCP1677086.1 DNA-binding transcriptional LysR family regulator [Natronocella acetinitrilica]
MRVNSPRRRGGSFGVPKSKLSRRLALLEQCLGVRLVNRPTRRLVLTEVGECYFRHCRAMLVEAYAVEALTAEPSGTIRLTCPIGLLNFHVGDMLALRSAALAAFGSGVDRVSGRALPGVGRRLITRR